MKQKNLTLTSLVLLSLACLRKSLDLTAAELLDKTENELSMYNALVDELDDVYGANDSN